MQLKSNDTQHKDPVNLDEIVTQLQQLSAKSNVHFCSSEYHKLYSFVMQNNNKIIPIKHDIISGIQNSKCPLVHVNGLIKLVAEFLISDYQEHHFTTIQFLQILCDPNNISCILSRDTKLVTPKVWRAFQLHHKIINETDERRKTLTIDNFNTLSGVYISSDPEEDDTDPINYDFINFMNQHLLDVSIITVSSDYWSLANPLSDMIFNKQKFTINSAVNKIINTHQQLSNFWDRECAHFIVGRTPEGHIVGYQSIVSYT
eukprot:24031_1